MKLILTRHGETIENKKRIVQGHIPGTLSKEGISQAEKLALRLKNEKIDVIYSSPLKRAKDTALKIRRYHKKTRIYYAEELKERNLGSITGKKGDELDWKNLPKDVETRESMGKRAKIFLDNVYKKFPEKTVVFVGHNGINKALIRVILNKPKKEIDSQLNTSVSVFEIKEDKKHKVHLLNCVKHLD